MLSANINHYDKAFHESKTEENRKGGRFPTTSVWSGLGEVIDLSFSGALLIKRRFKRVPGEETFAIKFKYEEMKAVVAARVVRESKKRGVGHLIAVEFVDLTEEQRGAIKEIVRNSRSWRIFDFEESEAA
ncbi:MAG: PilZ domain-containing protein [Phycisphaeraceae bacterium]